MSTKEAIIATQRLLENKESWTKESFSSVSRKGTKRWCLIGALEEVCPDISTVLAAKEILRGTIYNVYGNKYGGIISFNDALKTTHKDIMLVLNTSIETIKE